MLINIGLQQTRYELLLPWELMVLSSLGAFML